MYPHERGQTYVPSRKGTDICTFTEGVRHMYPHGRGQTYVPSRKGTDICTPHGRGQTSYVYPHGRGQTYVPSQKGTDICTLTEGDRHMYPHGRGQTYVPSRKGSDICTLMEGDRCLNPYIVAQSLNYLQTKKKSLRIFIWCWCVYFWLLWRLVPVFWHSSFPLSKPAPQYGYRIPTTTFTWHTHSRLQNIYIKVFYAFYCMRTEPWLPVVYPHNIDHRIAKHCVSFVL